MVTAWNLFGMKSVTFLISKVLEPQIDETQKTKLIINLWMLEINLKILTIIFITVLSETLSKIQCNYVFWIIITLILALEHTKVCFYFLINLLNP